MYLRPTTDDLVSSIFKKSEIKFNPNSTFQLPGFTTEMQRTNCPD